MARRLYWVVEGAPAIIEYILDGKVLARRLSGVGGDDPEWVRTFYRADQKSDHKIESGWRRDSHDSRDSELVKVVSISEVLPGPDWTPADGLPEDQRSPRRRWCRWRGREFILLQTYTTDAVIATIDPSLAASDPAWDDRKGEWYMWGRSVPLDKIEILSSE